MAIIKSGNEAAAWRKKKKKKKGGTTVTPLPSAPGTATPKTAPHETVTPLSKNKMQSFGGVEPPKQKPTMNWDEEKFGQPIEPTMPGLVPTSATHAANLHNLTLAYVEKWHAFPTAKTLEAMLQNTPTVWTRQQWYEMLAPLKSIAERPVIEEYASYTNSLTRPKGPRTIGVGEDIEETGRGLLGFSVDRDILNDPKEIFGKSFAWTGADAPFEGARTPDPDWKQLPKVIKVLNDEVHLGVGRMSPAQQQYLSSIGGGIIGYKKFLAEVLRKNGKPVPFNPNTTEWSESLNKEFHKYLFGRALPYALWSKDPETSANAMSTLAKIYPEILGKDIKDPSGLSSELLTTGAENLGDLLKNMGLDQAGAINLAYNGFVDGRVPGQSERQAMYDFVSEFGVEFLPVNAYKEYSDSLFTAGSIVGSVFHFPIAVGDFISDRGADMAEATDFLFDAWKDEPGAWGMIGDALHTTYEKAWTELNPVKMPFTAYKVFGEVLGTAMTGAALSVDVLMNISFSDTSAYDDAVYENALYEAGKVAIINGPDSDEEKTRKLKELDDAHNDTGLLGPLEAENMRKSIKLEQLLHWKTWSDRWKSIEVGGPVQSMTSNLLSSWGVAPDNPAAMAINELGQVGDFILMAKLAKGMDTGLRWSAKTGSEAVWSGARHLEERIGKKLIDPDAPIDFGGPPTNPNAIPPPRYLRSPTTGRFISPQSAEGQLLLAERLGPTKGKPSAGEEPSGGSNRPQEGPRGPRDRQHHVPFDRTPGEGPGEINVPRGFGGGRVPKGESEARLPKREGIGPEEPARISDEPGAVEIGSIPDRLPGTPEWGYDQDLHRMVSTFTEIPRGEPITPAHIGSVLEKVGVRGAAKDMILHEFVNMDARQGISVLHELVRRFKDSELYDSRYFSSVKDPSTGQLVAMLRGVRRNISESLVEARLELEYVKSGQSNLSEKFVRESIDNLEVSLGKCDANIQQVMRMPGGGMRAVIGRILEINNEIVELTKKGDKDSLAQVEELLSEKADLIRDPTQIADIETLGGEFRAYRTETPRGGPYRPYEPTDLNRAAGRPSVFEEADPTTRSRNKGPRGGGARGKRVDPDGLRNPAFKDSPLKSEEWKALLRGETVRGKLLKDILNSNDGVVLEHGTVAFDKGSAGFLDAAKSASEGKPVFTTKTPPKTGGKTPKNEEPTPPEGIEPPKDVSGGKPPKSGGSGTPAFGTPEYARSWYTRNIAEWIAQMTKPGDKSYPIIRAILNLKDDPKLLNPLIEKLQRANTSAEVRSIVDKFIEETGTEVEIMGPAFMRVQRARGVQGALDLAYKMGPVGEPLAAAIRMMGVHSQIQSVVDETGSPDVIREIGLASKMGKQKLGADVSARVTYWEDRMSKAIGGGRRRQVAREFEAEIKRNMGYKEKNGRDVSPADSQWAKYVAMRNKILKSRVGKFLEIAEGETGKTIDPHNRAYGMTDKVTAQRADLVLEKRNLQALLDSAIERGDKAKAADYRRALDVADAKFKEYVDACHDFVDLVDKPRKTQAEYDRLAAANKVLDGMGTSQPVWAHQLTHRIEFSIDHRILGWFQDGKTWQKFAKFDESLMDKPVKLWKQWAMFGFGFPVRVYLGDEIWRIPMEGISLRMARDAQRATRMLEGKLEGWSILKPFTASEKSRWKKLNEAQKERTLTDKEAAELEALKIRQHPMGGEFERLKMEDKSDMDFVNDFSDSFDMLFPETKTYRRADGTVEVRTVAPNDALYFPAVKHVIEKLGSDPVIAELMKAEKPKDGWTAETAREFLNTLILRRDKVGVDIRQFLADTERITESMLRPSELRKALKEPTSGTYRNVWNCVNEWADVWVKVDGNPILKQGVKDGYISIESLNAVPGESLFGVPVVRRISQASVVESIPFLNIPSKVYNGFRIRGIEHDIGTLPLMIWMGTKVRSTLFGAKYLEELKKAGVKLEDYRDNPAEYLRQNREVSRRAAQVAADFADRTTFTRNATLFEDQVRNLVPFINSYRQFWVYWGKKMVTRPVTMAAIWEYAPQIPISSQLGPVQAFLSGFQPFITQPDGDNEKAPGLAGLAPAVFQQPSLNPGGAAVLAYAIRGMTNTQADLTTVPGLGSTGGGFTPGGKMGQLIEGTVGLPEPLKGTIFKDDTATSMGWNSIIGRYTEIPEDSVGEKELEVKLPWPLNFISLIGDHVHNVNALTEAVTGTMGVTARFTDPVTAKYDQENIKYRKLLNEGKYKEAAEFLDVTEYLRDVINIRQSNDPQFILETKVARPELVRLVAGRYDWETNGDLYYRQDWDRTALPTEEFRNNLREEWRTIYGGVPLDEQGRPDRSRTYGGDINRPEAMKIKRDHLKEINDYAKSVAHRLSGGNKKFEKALLSEWKSKINDDIAVDEYLSVPNAPGWYLDALKADGKDPKMWNPKVYMEGIYGFYGGQARGVPYRPSNETMDRVRQLEKEGVFDEDTQRALFSPYSRFGPRALKREKFVVDDYRKKFIDLNEEGWYNLDARTLRRIGFRVPDEIDKTLLRVRKAYYDYRDVGDKYGTSSREYRDARNKFYAYKDREFLKVKGGEIFVGGLPKRLLNCPFIGAGDYKFTGEGAEDNRKLWKEFINEAQKEKPDLKKLTELKSHFNKELEDKVDDWNASAKWAYVLGVAQYMRYVMKNSYSEYYQGPGNSAYSTEGKKFVANLERMIQSYMTDETYDDPDQNSFRRDVRLYWGDAHDLSWKLLEWYNY